MAKKTVILPKGTESLPIGTALTLNLAAMTALTPIMDSKSGRIMTRGDNGVVVADERIEVTGWHGDRPVVYTVSVYVQRQALSDDESNIAGKTAAERKATKELRERQADETRQREIQAAVNLTRDTFVQATKAVARDTTPATMLKEAIEASQLLSQLQNALVKS